MRFVLDSSVIIAAATPEEAMHASAANFLDHLRASLAAGDARAFAPPELWLEVHVVEHKRTRTRRPTHAEGGAMAGLAVELVSPADAAELTAFLALLVQRMRGRRPFANGTDLVYLWAAWSVDATVVTLDEGLVAYHGVVCDVTRPQHVRFGARRPPA